MKLVHYSDEIIKGPFRVHVRGDATFKPDGLWVSDEDDYGWATWCLAEGFQVQRLRYIHDIILKIPNNILMITTAESLVDFDKKYAGNEVSRFYYWLLPPNLGMYHLNWKAVYADWDGVIISPYQWQYRLDLDHMWYYAWDCAGGCIWNLDVVESIICRTSS